MTLSPEMRKKLLDRLTALDKQPPISLLGPDLRAATVEDAELLASRFRSWLDVFFDLGMTCTSEDDRASFQRLYDTFDRLVTDLEAAIRATRDRGVPWEETLNYPSAPQLPSLVVAREIRGELNIGPNIIVVTAVDNRTKKGPAS